MPAFRKTRIAPTPSGFLHAGNALNFLLTAALAQQHGASLFLRIDDLDRARYRAAYAQDIFDTLCFLNIPWQEGPKNLDDFETGWSQQHRLQLYHEVLKKLREKDAVFACTCSRVQSADCRCYQKHLSLDTPGASWRLHTDETPITFKTIEGNCITTPLPTEVKNFVVRRKDGVPAYQLASVVDDLHFGIDFIVRGEDLWPSTLAQLYLATQLEEERFASIRFYHHPLLTAPDGAKLSKSAGATSVKQWRESGKTRNEFLRHFGRLLPASISAMDRTDL